MVLVLEAAVLSDKFCYKLELPGINKQMDQY